MEKEYNCPFCTLQIQKDFNFCPHCGEGLTDLAKEIVKKQNACAQLKLVGLLIDKVKDKKTLELLEKLTEMYKNN